jgi:3-hydroxyacyl-CoA dehydrogenase
MSEVTQYAVRDGVAVISMNSPPVNGLSNALRAAIVENLEKADKDPSVKAVVLIGSAKAFSGGADIREFNKPRVKPDLPDVNDRQDAMTKPLVAAVGGFALGGGLELALACHYRVAAPKALLGLPEVKLGILPGSGGTQRLPRVVPMAEAVQMMTTGTPIPAEKAKALGLVDEVAQGDLLDSAIQFAKGKVGKPLPRIRDRSVKLEDAKTFFAQAREQVAKASRGYPAPLEIVGCAEAAATKPFDEGRKHEREAFARLVDTTESKSLRHAFFAERQTSKIPDVPEDTPVREIRKAAVLGAGTMGGGIAMNFANAGIPVTLIDMNQAAVDKGVGIIKKNYAATVSKGRLKQEDMDKRMALIKPSTDLPADADIYIEAVFERMDVKQDVFKKLDALAKPGAILATNTSTLDVDLIAAATKRPQDVIGTHFFSPANVMRLLEVVRGKKTDKSVLATTMKLGKALKKLPVVSGVCDGFIGNRMIAMYQREALLMLEEGASPQQVDGAIESFGFAMGPLKMSDLAGGDIGWAIRKRQYAERPDMRRVLIADRLCELGRFGQKTGSGFYRYEPGRRDALPDSAVDAVIDACRKELGVTPRTLSDEEIVQRCVFALVNEGARILEEGIAQRASDIDLVYLSGYGFPVFRGGPMLYADSVGLMNVVRAMEGFAANPRGHRAFWQPAPLLARLAAEGKTFN